MKKVIIEKLVPNQLTELGQIVDLTVKKYSREVFFDNLWNEHPECVKARGAVFHGDRQVVFPMDKCFNYKENDVGLDMPLDTKVWAYKKLNGFMFNATFDDKIGWIFSTTGDAVVGNNPTQNKFLNWGREYFLSKDFIKKYFNTCEALGHRKNVTCTFEACHPEDVHIIVEEYGMHPLCLQVDGVSHPIVEVGFAEGDVVVCTLGELLEKVKTVKHEGFMVYDESGLKFKLKSPYYLAKKWLQRGGYDKVWSDRYKQRLDEEYYPIVEWLRGNFSKDQWKDMTEFEKSEAFLKALCFMNG